MTAQSILNEEKKENTATACGTACGATDDAQTEDTKETEATSTACGSSCGAGE